MKSRLWLMAALAVPAVSACREDLSAPGHCPELCPGTQIPVFDTTIAAIAGSDSTFFGYIPQAARQGLLVSNGLPAGEARAFMVFPAIRADSFTIDGALREFTPDTAAITLTLQARDSTVKNLKVYLHRLPLTTDSSIDYAGLDAAITAGPVVDSILVPDTLKTGTIQAILTGADIDRLRTAPEDSGKIALGLRVAADRPTGIRIALDPAGLTNSAPLYELKGKIDIVDTTRQRQTASVRATDPARTGYRFATVAADQPDPDLLYLGGPRSGRAIVRFAVPPGIKDSAQILRATLELTPAAPLFGLPGASLADSVSARGVVVDLGAKSPPLAANTSPVLSGPLVEGTTDPVSIDVLALILQWKAENGPPQVILLSHNRENAWFMQPVFYSTRSPTGQPRLRIIYAQPTGSNTP